MIFIRPFSWIKKLTDYQDYKLSVKSDLCKILESSNCGIILKKSVELNFVNFFSVGFKDYKLFVVLFEKAIILMNKLDNLFELASFKEYLRECQSSDGNIKKERSIKVKSKLLTIAFVGYNIDKEFSYRFIKEFVCDRTFDEVVERYSPVLDVICSANVSGENNFRGIIESIITQIDDQSFKFPLNLVYFVSCLENDGIVLTDFIKFLTKKGMKIKIKHKFQELDI